jgi:hypothetical protein
MAVPLPTIEQQQRAKWDLLLQISKRAPSNCATAKPIILSRWNQQVMFRDDRNAVIAAKQICAAVIATVNETPTSAPGVAMYAALMQWISHDQFEAMIAAGDTLLWITRTGVLLKDSARYDLDTELAKRARQATQRFDMRPHDWRDLIRERPGTADWEAALEALQADADAALPE